MGSPISPLIATIFMEEFEVKALQSFPTLPPYGSGLWMTPLSSIRQNTAKTCSSTSTARTHTSSSQWSPHTRITTILDTLVTIHTDNNSTPQSTGSPHTQTNTSTGTATTTITAKQRVYNTLAHRAKTVSSTQDNLQKELTHIKTALHHCQFPSWVLNQLEHKFNQPNPPAAHANSNNNNNSPSSNKYKATIVVPYINKTAEKFKRLCKSRGIQVHFKGTNTLRTALGNLKEKDPKTNQTGIIYKYQCPHIHCTSSYIGQSGTSWGKELRNTSRPLPPYTTTVPPQDIPWIPTSLTLFTKR